jgi:CHAT domain-containing protein
LNDYREVQAQIRLSSAHYAALTQPEQITLENIQKTVLDHDTVLLEYFLGEERSFVFAITDDKLVVYPLPKRSEIEALARAVYDSWSYPSAARKRPSSIQLKLSSPRQLQTLNASLSRILLNPVSKFLAGKRVLVVGDGALQYIPFAALYHDRDQLIVTNHEVISLPSAAALAALRKEIQSRPPPAKELAVLADPVFAANDPRVQQRNEPTQTNEDNNTRALSAIEFGTSMRDVGIKNEIPRLPATRWEAIQISKLVPPTQQKVALDFQANRAAAIDGSLREYRIVHFATHGLLNNRRPELSGIVLSLVNEGGRSENGFLQVHEIYNLRLRADLVVLSACRTALGKDISGEGVVGLTRAFMYAGAARVVSSLWEVESKATAELMTRFYRKMLREKLEPAAALRAAQISMSQDPRWRSPYYWAGFVIQGDYR